MSPGKCRPARTTRVAAFFCMNLAGHFNRTLPVVARLARAGVRAVVFTHAGFRRRVEEAGAEFVDLFGPRPLEGVDDATTPRSARYVTWAARHGEEVASEVASLRPSVVLYDTFAVIGRFVANALGLPHVNLCAGHAADRDAIAADLRRAGFVRLSPRCLEAVRRLRDAGLEDADPFMYVATRSPFLNVHGEPKPFLDPEGRSDPRTDAFFGSIPDDAEARPGAERFFPGKARLRLYVSFGTMIRNFHAAEARRALAAIGDAARRLDWVEAVISLSGADQPPGIAGPNVSVRPHVDQWAILREADLFVTHHGLNSTHEAIFHRVPMASYPFLWDQPALARRCGELGLALPLAPAPLAPLTPDAVTRVLEESVDRREAMRLDLERARAWEIEAIGGRDAVIRRITGLME